MRSQNSLKSRLSLSFLISVPCLTACGKKQEPPTPELSAPKKVLARDEAPGATRDVPAAAEVKASSGPVQLTLRIYKTKIRAIESLWHQIQVTNLGKEELLITDQIFHDPWKLGDQIMKRVGIYLEVIGPDGKPLAVPLARSRYADPDPAALGGVSGLLEVDGLKEQAMLEAWKKQGTSEYDISQKLVAYNMKKRRDAEVDVKRPHIKLKPGERAETKSWFYHNASDRRRKKPVPKPIGEFRELEFYDLDKPGKYKIRAVYALGMNEDEKRTYAELDLTTYGLVTAHTPWIEVEVLP